MLSITIPVTTATVGAIKGELTRSLPQVKSQHRCEALGRGLGFRTYKGCLTAAEAQAPPVVEVDWEAFSSYLTDHGFSGVPSKPFVDAVGREALRLAASSVPNLTAAGLGHVSRGRQPGETHLQRIDRENKEFQAYRRELLSGSLVEEFLISIACLSRLTPTKTVRPDGSNSYRLKHIAENYRSTYPGGETLAPGYVSNGALIAAAIHLGFRFKSYGPQSINVGFNIGKRQIEDLDCEVRPNGAVAQQRKAHEEMRQRRAQGIWVPA